MRESVSGCEGGCVGGCMVATFATSKLFAKSMLALRLAATADGGSVPAQATGSAEVRSARCPSSTGHDTCAAHMFATSYRLCATDKTWRRQVKTA